MSTTRPHRQDEALRYEIRVKGHLAQRWSSWFDGMTLTRPADGSTVIAGVVADQPALHGLLQRLRDLGLPLISVTSLDPIQPTPASDNSEGDRS
jgi:hypothetical protein